MKVDFGQEIIGLDGEAIRDEAGPLTLGRVAAAALNVPSENHALERGMLAIKVYMGGAADITPEESAMIREALPKAWVPVIVARAHHMLGG